MMMRAGRLLGPVVDQLALELRRQLLRRTFPADLRAAAPRRCPEQGPAGLRGNRSHCLWRTQDRIARFHRLRAGLDSGFTRRRDARLRIGASLWIGAPLRIRTALRIAVVLRIGGCACCRRAAARRRRIGVPADLPGRRIRQGVGLIVLVAPPHGLARILRRGIAAAIPLRRVGRRITRILGGWILLGRSACRPDQHTAQTRKGGDKASIYQIPSNYTQHATSIQRALSTLSFPQDRGTFKTEYGRGPQAATNPLQSWWREGMTVAELG